jgi:hypothetical protein
MTLTPDLSDLSNKKKPLGFDATPASRTIKAIVERNQPGTIEGLHRAISANMTITVTNDPATGICTAAAITAANAFDQILIDTAAMTIAIFDWEDITYYPAGSVLDVNLDEVLLAARKGETPTRHRITKIIEQDAGMLVLEVR